MAINRRDFIRSVAGAASVAALDGVAPHPTNSQQLPTPDASGIEHIVLVMMENRSFDHFLGWLPGAHGVQAGLIYEDSVANSIPPPA